MLKSMEPTFSVVWEWRWCILHTGGETQNPILSARSMCILSLWIPLPWQPKYMKIPLQWQQKFNMVVYNSCLLLKATNPNKRMGKIRGGRKFIGLDIENLLHWSWTLKDEPHRLALDTCLLYLCKYLCHGSQNICKYLCNGSKWKVQYGGVQFLSPNLTNPYTRMGIIRGERKLIGLAIINLICWSWTLKD